MEIFNGTPEHVTAMYDSVDYHFPPREIVSLGEDEGQFIVQKYAGLGLCQVKFNDDIKQRTLECMERRAAFHREQIAMHEQSDYDQDSLKLRRLQKSHGVLKAEKMLPIYDAVLEALRDGRDYDEATLPPAAKEFLSTMKTGNPKPDLALLTAKQLKAHMDKLGIPSARPMSKGEMIALIEERENVAA